MKSLNTNNIASLIVERTKEAEINKTISAIQDILPGVLQDIASAAEEGYDYFKLMPSQDLDKDKLNSVAKSLERLGFMCSEKWLWSDSGVYKGIYYLISWKHPKKRANNNLAKTMLETTRIAIENNKNLVGEELLPQVLDRIRDASDQGNYSLTIYEEEMKQGQRTTLGKSLSNLGFYTRVYEHIYIYWGEAAKRQKIEGWIANCLVLLFLSPLIGLLISFFLPPK